MHASDKARIDAFLDQPDIGLAGYSRNPRKFGHTIYKTLKEKGYRLFPVNPAGGEAPGGETIYPDVASLPGEVNALVVVTRADVTPVVVDQALLKGIDYLWIQQMSGSKQFYVRKGNMKRVQEDLFGEGFNVLGVIPRSNVSDLRKRVVDSLKSAYQIDVLAEFFSADYRSSIYLHGLLRHSHLFIAHDDHMFSALKSDNTFAGLIQDYFTIDNEYDKWINDYLKYQWIEN